MADRVRHDSKQRVKEGEKHDCSTTTEAALTEELSEDLRDAWERLGETAVSFGDQRIYASHKSIMFARKSCYFFVRPKESFLELCVFLGRALKAPQVRRIDRASKAKLVHLIHIRHRDEVEAPNGCGELSHGRTKGRKARMRPAIAISITIRSSIAAAPASGLL